VISKVIISMGSDRILPSAPDDRHGSHLGMPMIGMEIVVLSGASGLVNRAPECFLGFVSRALHVRPELRDAA
jgi:hypothetical protein